MDRKIAALPPKPKPIPAAVTRALRRLSLQECYDLWNAGYMRHQSAAVRGHLQGEPAMLLDILIAAVIVIIAAALGLTVHPLLWFLVILAVIWLFARRGSWSR